MIVADRIVDDLFTNGMEEKANRLVLEDAEGRQLGGWSREAATRRIADILDQAE